MQPSPLPENGAIIIKFSVAILAVWLVAFLPMESGPIWIPAARMHFSVSAVAMGFVASLQFGVSATMAMFVAPRLTKWKLRMPLLAATGIIFLAALASAALPLNLYAFILMRMLDGGASGICVACAAILATRTAQPSRSFGILQFGQILTNMVVYVTSTKVVAAHGMTGVYYLISGGTVIFFVVQFFGKGWPVVMPHRAGGRAPSQIRVSKPRILAACLGAALVYCGFIALVANASALGARAGLDITHVTIILAASTCTAAVGALISTLLAGRVQGSWLIGASAAGAAFTGLLLAFTAFDFETLIICLGALIFFVYLGFPSIFGGIARLDETGRSASAAQAAQMFGPALGPAIGALVATHSVAGLALSSTAFVVFGALTAGLAVRPAARQNFAVQPAIAQAQS